MAVKLSWTPRVLGSAIRVYRSSMIFDKDSLPTPLDTLPADANTYEDSTGLVGVDYFYAIGVVGFLSPEVVALSRVVSVRVTEGAGPPPEPAELVRSVLDPLNAAVLVGIENDFLRYRRIAGFSYVSAKATNGHSSGKFYLEATYTTWANTGGTYTGFCTSAFSLTETPGSNARQFYLTAAGAAGRGTSSQVNAFSTQLSFGDRVGWAVDLDAAKYWVRKNNGAWNPNIAGTQDPASGDGGIAFTGLSGELKPFVCTVFGTTQLDLVFDGDDFVDTPPTGFSPWRTGDAVTVGGAHRYWRVVFLGNQSGGATATNAIADLQLRSSIGGADLTGSGTPTASSITNGLVPASNAFDGSGTSYWQSSGYLGEWLSYDLGVGNDAEIIEIAIAKRPDATGANQAPLAGAIGYSDNGTTWTFDWSFTTTADWSTGAETRVFSKP